MYDRVGFVVGSIDHQGFIDAQHYLHNVQHPVDMKFSGRHPFRWNVVTQDWCEHTKLTLTQDEILTVQYWLERNNFKETTYDST